MVFTKKITDADIVKSIRGFVISMDSATVRDLFLDKINKSEIDLGGKIETIDYYVKGNKESALKENNINRTIVETKDFKVDIRKFCCVGYYTQTVTVEDKVDYLHVLTIKPTAGLIDRDCLAIFKSTGFALGLVKVFDEFITMKETIWKRRNDIEELKRLLNIDLLKLRGVYGDQWGYPSV